MSPQLLLLLYSALGLLQIAAIAEASSRDPPSPHCLKSKDPPGSAKQSVVSGGGSAVVAKFGIITDVHYADAPADRDRHYRDSLPKVRDAVRDISAARADFLIELGDFKDTDASQHCADKVVPSTHCVNITLGFLSEIEETVAVGFGGPRYHVLGNHDVDILAQAQALSEENNTNGPNHPMSSGNMSEGYYSFEFPFPAAPVGPDTMGCLVGDGHNVWVLHSDATRNWLSGGCDHALQIKDVDSFPKRHQGRGPYSLNASASALTCAQSASCVVGHLPLAPHPPALRFLVLNADFTDEDVPWYDLDGPDAAAKGISWEKANVPTKQLTWLASELLLSRSAGQHVIVFVHYRVDGGPGGPVSPPSAWVTDCSLQNAAVVRAVLEEWPGLVLATFSGHDHLPHPPYTKVAPGKPLYFTHAGLIEGAYSEGHNAYSVVSILNDCSIVVRGWADAENVTVPGPSNCMLAGADAGSESSVLV